MNRPQNQRRGVVIGLSALAGLATAALGVVGIAQHGGVAAQQQDIALKNAADVAHTNLVDAQVTQDHSLFNQDVALQQSIYYWANQNDFDQFLFPGSPADPQDSLFNGAFSRFTEAQLVGQAIQQAQWDHQLGVNQTAGIGGVPPGPDGGSPGGYETAIGTALYNDLSGAGITPGSDLADDLAALQDPDVLESASGFHSALVTLQGDLMQVAFSDVLGILSGDAGVAAADATGGIDLPF